MDRKVLKIYLIAAVVGLVLCGCGSVPNGQEPVTEYVAADAAGEKDKASAVPESAMPDAADQAAREQTTTTPTATATPAVASTPKAVATPAATSTPKATATPKATSTPKATATPAATETSSATAAPKATETPTTAKATEAPAETPVPAHTHTFVDRTVSEATCTEAKVVESVCSVCGASNGTRTEGSALGHDLYEDWFNAPNCTDGGWVTERCHRCDYANGHAGTPLGHDWEETSTTGWNCVTSGVTRQTCKRCGAPGDSWENGQYGPHDWETYTVKEMNWETLEEIETEVTRCGWCGETQ